MEKKKNERADHGALCVCVCGLLMLYLYSLKVTALHCTALHCWGIPWYCSIKPTTPVRTVRQGQGGNTFVAVSVWFLRNVCYNGRLQCLKKTFHESSKGKRRKRERWGRSLLLIGFRVIVLPHPTPNTLSFLLFHPSFLLVRSFIFFFLRFKQRSWPLGQGTFQRSSPSLSFRC